MRKAPKDTWIRLESHKEWARHKDIDRGSIWQKRTCKMLDYEVGVNGVKGLSVIPGKFRKTNTLSGGLKQSERGGNVQNAPGKVRYGLNRKAYWCNPVN